MGKINAGQIVNKWVGTGTITNLEFVKEINKYRFFLKQPAVIVDGDGDDALHINEFSVNLPAKLNAMMTNYKNGDFVYCEGFLAQSDQSKSVKVKMLYIRHFDPVMINVEE